MNLARWFEAKKWHKYIWIYFPLIFIRRSEVETWILGTGDFALGVASMSLSSANMSAPLFGVLKIEPDARLPRGVLTRRDLLNIYLKHGWGDQWSLEHRHLNREETPLPVVWRPRVTVELQLARQVKGAVQQLVRRVGAKATHFSQLIIATFLQPLSGIESRDLWSWCCWDIYLPSSSSFNSFSLSVSIVELTLTSEPGSSLLDDDQWQVKAYKHNKGSMHRREAQKAAITCWSTCWEDSDKGRCSKDQPCGNCMPSSCNHSCTCTLVGVACNLIRTVKICCSHLLENFSSWPVYHLLRPRLPPPPLWWRWPSSFCPQPPEGKDI